MTFATEAKNDLHRYLRDMRETVRWKLEGLSEYDLRRPMTPTGTNLLGLAKHLTSVELVYFGVVFGRFPDDPPSWFGQDLEPNTHMWATAEEPRELIINAYQRACDHADATIAAHDLDHVGTVPWWGEQQASLHRIMLHVVYETSRHVGHLDIVRELLDGVIGARHDDDQLSQGDPTVRDAQWWRSYRDRIEQAASDAATRATA